MLQAFEVALVTNSPAIKVEEQLRCYMCGGHGAILYRELKDRLFGVSGDWSIRECEDSNCGLQWLDPLPYESEIAKAYETYMTHVVSSAESQKETPANLVRKAVVGLYRCVEHLTPLPSERRKARMGYLDEIRPGRVLDVGCGDGSLLVRLRALGWEVEGQDVDAKAAAHSRQSEGVTVHLGQLADLAIPSSRYDAVVMNHVIEHVHDPVMALRELHRLLRTGGTLIVVTPNAKSYGHRRFGRDWINLDPPRHLHLFSTTTLLALANQAGFQQCVTWTTTANADFVAVASTNLRRYGTYDMFAQVRILSRAAAAFFQLVERAILVFDSQAGEECVLRATK